MKFNLKSEAEKGVIDNNNNIQNNNVTANNTVNKNNNVQAKNAINKNKKVNNNIDKELEFNKKNRENYENLMSESSTQLDGYWDSKNPFVKIFLLALLAFIVLGVIYYVMTFIATR